MSDAVRKVDRELATLITGIHALRLPVDVIVLSDHGMAQYQGDFVDLHQFDPDLLSHEKRIGALMYPYSEADANRTYLALHNKSDKFAVYQRADTPPYLHFSSNVRSGDPILVATGPYAIGIADTQQPHPRPAGGNHGYDPARVPDMKASFFAIGPDIKAHTILPPFENVDVYPLVAHILGLDITSLKTGPIDGRLSVLKAILKSR